MEMKKEYFLEEIIIVHADEFDKVLSIDSTNINFSKVSSKVTRTHCVKSVRIRSFPGWYFPTFGLNTDQKNFEYERFSRSNNFQSLLLILNQSNQFLQFFITDFGYIFVLKRDEHCVKRVRIRSYSGSYFPVFSPQAGKCGKNEDKDNSECGTFLLSGKVNVRRVLHPYRNQSIDLHCYRFA